MVFICYRLDWLTHDGTGLDLEVDNFNWIRYIKIVQSRSRLDQIVDSIIFSVWIKNPSPTSDTAIDVDLHQDQ